MADDILISTCQCGKVQCQGVGRPIISGVCYCDDCQAGADTVEALDGAAQVRDDDGGSHYLTYRDDRFSCTKGADLLRAYKNRPDAPTDRMVASCCNTAMFLKFSKGHWTSAYARRFEGDAPSVEMRTQMQFRDSDLPLPDDAPNYQTFGVRLFWRLFTSRIAMIFG
ncbi:GFA family protein [Parasphingorhabdus sp.]|uniref:GFA family protein n=1 Tax=Parasphingorhabdus sp. TaxID=2709688 RepID=UPI003D2A0859